MSQNLIFTNQMFAKKYGEKRIIFVYNTELETKNGGGSVMLWGCIAGVGELIFIDTAMDKHLYLNILKENLQKSANKLGIGTSFYFQQDCDPKHTTHNQWLLYNTPHMLHTAPQSLDINPIEHVWWKLEKRIR